MRSVGVSFPDRGRIADEYLAAMRAVWTQPKPSFKGRFVSFEGVQAMPRPVQTPMPKIVVGGRTAPAFRRAVTQAHGWYGFGLDVPTTERFVAALGDAAKKHPRPGRARPARDQRDAGRASTCPTRATVDAYAAAGVDRLIIRPKPDMDAPRSSASPATRRAARSGSPDLSSPSRWKIRSSGPDRECLRQLEKTARSAT